MKLRLLTLGLIAFLFAQCIELNAQIAADDNPLMPKEKVSPIYVGPVLGYNRSLHSVTLPSFALDDLCPKFENGTQNGFYAGISFEYLLGDPANSKSSIIARVLYNSLPAELEEGGDPYPSRVEDLSGNEVIIISTTRHTQKVAYNLITFEAQYKLNFFESTLGVTVGPTFDFAMTKTHVQKFELLEPLEAQFKRPEDWEKKIIRYENNDRTIITKDGDIENASGFRLGLKAGIQYEILLGRMYVVPSASYNFGVTNLVSDQDWRVNAIQMGVDVRFSI